MRVHEALGVLAKTPKAAPQKKAKPAKNRGLATRLPSAPTPEEALDLPNRLSPLITDGSKRATVWIGSVLWPRFV
jgi:hypothetical protein